MKSGTVMEQLNTSYAAYLPGLALPCESCHPALWHEIKHRTLFLRLLA